VDKLKVRILAMRQKNNSKKEKRKRGNRKNSDTNP
jgi:hypothetical protein